MSDTTGPEVIDLMPDVDVHQAYSDVYGEILDVLESESTLGPIDATTFKEVVYEIVERLIGMADNDYSKENQS